jgi:hypothetical protein
VLFKRGEIIPGRNWTKIVDRVIGLGSVAFAARDYEIVEQSGSARALGHYVVPVSSLQRQGLRGEFGRAIEALAAILCERTAQGIEGARFVAITTFHPIKRRLIVVEPDKLQFVIRPAIERMSGDLIESGHEP